MSNTHKHKGKGYFNNGLKNKPEVKKYINHWNRNNFDKGLYKAQKIKAIEMIAENEFKEELSLIKN